MTISGKTYIASISNEEFAANEDLYLTYVGNLTKLKRMDCGTAATLATGDSGPLAFLQSEYLLDHIHPNSMVHSVDFARDNCDALRKDVRDIIYQEVYFQHILNDAFCRDNYSFYKLPFKDDGLNWQVVADNFGLPFRMTGMPFDSVAMRAMAVAKNKSITVVPNVGAVIFFPSSAGEKCFIIGSSKKLVESIYPGGIECRCFIRRNTYIEGSFRKHALHVDSMRTGKRRRFGDIVDDVDHMIEDECFIPTESIDDDAIVLRWDGPLSTLFWCCRPFVDVCDMNVHALQVYTVL